MSRARANRSNNQTRVVSAPVLSAWIAVTPKTVRELATRGVVVRAGRGAYRLEESVRGYCEHMRKSASARGGEDSLAQVRAQRIRLAKAQADAMELKNAALRGEFIEAAAVEFEWSAVLRNVRAGVLTVPNRVAQRLPHLTAHDVLEIDREVRDALAEVGNGQRS